MDSLLLKVKAFFKSKTLVVSLATVVLAHVPEVTNWVTANVGGTTAVTVLGVVFAVLRYLTTGSVADKVQPPAA